MLSRSAFWICFLTFLMVYVTDVNLEMEFLGQMLNTSTALHIGKSNHLNFLQQFLSMLVSLIIH